MRMGTPWYDCANDVRRRAGWQCECTGACAWPGLPAVHTGRCAAKQDRPSPRDPLPMVPHRQEPRERIRVFAVHRADIACADPRPVACHDADHYAAWCHECRFDIASTQVEVERREFVRARKCKRLAAALARRALLTHID